MEDKISKKMEGKRINAAKKTIKEAELKERKTRQRDLVTKKETKTIRK